MSVSATLTGTVIAAGGNPPTKSQNFSSWNTVGAMLADPYWSQGSDQVRSDLISLGTDGGPPGGSSHYMRYTFPTNVALQNGLAANVSGGRPNLPYCNDFTVQLRHYLVSHANAGTDFWLRIWDRFNGPFDPGTNATCAPHGVAYKHTFAGVDGSSRFQNVLGINGLGGGITCGWPNDEVHWTNITPPPTSSYFTGSWVEWRFHWKVGATGCAFFWFNGSIFASASNVNIAKNYIDRIMIGANMNMLASKTYDMTRDIGLIDYWIGTDPGWGF